MHRSVAVDSIILSHAASATVALPLNQPSSRHLTFVTSHDDDDSIYRCSLHCVLLNTYITAERGHFAQSAPKIGPATKAPYIAAVASEMKVSCDYAL